MVYCSEYKPKKVGEEWINEGSCEFRIMYNQTKSFGREITPLEIKSLIDGEIVLNGARKMSLDLSNDGFFVKTDKDEDEDL
ncbi:hypothetical protein N5T78_10345 [Aliarcobacter cryaerophilus]|uniref:hypothetical protein n=1 Tax=Aliarcobacter cryaerophilus TaxID=28198 RepID=UPI0021B61B29|nr:hypothetical protein [Aliarcobacter cryaerophilus]MCT7466981.1 hypothetical protein [Aliarcobacter cryaerophilus]